jgi:hypothetical protein
MTNQSYKNVYYFQKNVPDLCIAKNKSYDLNESTICVLVRLFVCES